MSDKTITGIVTWLRNWFYDESEVDNLLNSKQNTLVSGTNIKTINNQSLLGQGNISIQGGGSDVVDLIYPVGSIYMSVNSTSPSTLFGGTWEKIEDTFLLASGTTYSNGSTGGSATVTLTENQMPSHTHTQNAHTHTGTDGRGFVTHTEGKSVTQKRVSVPSSGSNYAPIITSSDNWYSVGSVGSTTATNQNKGGGQAHNNMPPYLTVNVWKRTA